MPVQINIWLLLFGALQGLLLSFFMVRKKSYRNGYAFLIAYLLLIIAQILFKVADKQWMMEGMRTTYFLSYKFPFLYGPLIWLFTRQLAINSSRFMMKDLLHFIPFLYCLVVLNLDYSSPLHLPLNSEPTLLLQIISLVCYHVLALQLWKRHTKNVRDYFSDVHAFKMKWVRNFIVISLIACLIISLLTYFIYQLYPAHNWLRFGFLLLCIFIYWISYSALQQPALFVSPFHEKKPIPVVPTMVVESPVKKYANSTMTNEEAIRIIGQLEVIMRTKRMFAEPELTIDLLAASLDTNRYILSQVLNERLNQSFYEYINGLRIEAAQEMLVNPSFNSYKIAAIGYEAGFNSLSSFNDVFKKISGCTPSQYKKQWLSVEQKQRV